MTLLRPDLLKSSRTETQLGEIDAAFSSSPSLSLNRTEAEFACHALFLFRLGVIPALLSLHRSLEVGRFAFTAGGFVTSRVNEAGLYGKEAELQLQGKKKEKKKQAAAR